jgi:hypothetical protein
MQNEYRITYSLGMCTMLLMFSKRPEVGLSGTVRDAAESTSKLELERGWEPTRRLTSLEGLEERKHRWDVILEMRLESYTVI